MHAMRIITRLLVVTGFAAASKPEIDWVDCHDNVPTTLLQSFPNADIKNLPPTLHCGRITVPMNYERPLSCDNNITLGLAMYRPSDPKGLLFYNPGGTDPGAVLAWTVALGLNTPFTPNFSGLLEFDLMMMDVRGTWSSNPLYVDVDLAGELLQYPFPTNVTAFNEYQAVVKKVIASFEQKSTPPGIIQHVGTREATQDFDQIRQALGYDTIDFLGASYGTYRAAQYAATFPDRVGRFVLDAVVPHGLSIAKDAQYELEGFSRGLERADAFCRNNNTCPLHISKSASGVLGAWKESLKHASNGSLFPCSEKIAACKQPLSTHLLQVWLTNTFGQNHPDFPCIIEGLASAARGIVPYSNTCGPSEKLAVSGLWGIPLYLNDYRIEDPTFETFERMFKAAEKFDKYNVGYTIAYQTQLIGSAWPYYAAPIKPLYLNATMLLVTADFDDYAPTEFTTFEWKTQAPNSGLVVRHGDGHVTFVLPYETATHLEKEFLRTGELPTARNHTFVTVYEPGSVRDGIPSPYDVPTGFAAGDIDSAH